MVVFPWECIVLSDKPPRVEEMMEDEGIAASIMLPGGGRLRKVVGILSAERSMVTWNGL